MHDMSLGWLDDATLEDRLWGCLMGELTRADEAEVERGQTAAGDSLEQREAEKVAIRLLGQQLGVMLEPRRIPFPEGGRLELDGASDQPPTLVEVWAHQGPPKAAQKAKVMTDAMRLLLAARVLRTDPRLILALTDHAAAAHLSAEAGWRRHFGRLGSRCESSSCPMRSGRRCYGRRCGSIGDTASRRSGDTHLSGRPEPNHPVPLIRLLARGRVVQQQPASVRARPDLW